jgi:hypothetical protein
MHMSRRQLSRLNKRIKPLNARRRASKAERSLCRRNQRGDLVQSHRVVVFK